MGAISGMGGNKIVRIIFRERKVPRLFCLFVCLEKKVALLFRVSFWEREK
jgi:tRNA A22 N-methylase